MACSAYTLSLGVPSRTHALSLSPHSKRARSTPSRPAHAGPACTLQTHSSVRVGSTSLTRVPQGAGLGLGRGVELRERFPLRSPSLLFPQRSQGPSWAPLHVTAEAKPRGREAAANTTSAPKQPNPGSQYLGKLSQDSAATRAAAGAYPAPARRHPLAARAVFVTLAIAVALPVLGGVIVSSVANPLQDWYRDLEKPSWEPPDWLFGAMWSVLYVFMGLASWLVWADGGWAKQGFALKLYCAQLLVNYSWPLVFFSLHQLPLGVAVIGALVLLVNATMRAFYSVNALAGWLMLPYLAWTTFALALNIALWRKNRTPGDTTMPGARWSAIPRQADDPAPRRDDW